MPVQYFAALLNEPRRFKKHLLVCLLIATVISVFCVYFVDQKLSLWLNEPSQRDLLWLPAREMTNVALSEWYFIICVAAWFITAWITPRISNLQLLEKKSDFIRRWSLNFLLALLFSGAITHILKFTVGRQRPHKSPDFEAQIFDHLTTHWHWHSFSSGHSQVIFTAAVFFSLLAPRFSWFFVLFAIASAATRVIIHDHFLSDVIAGAFVGYIGSLLALKILHSRKNGLLKTV